MAGLATGRDSTRETAHREAVAVPDTDTDVRLLQARNAESRHDERDHSPVAPSSCLLCAEELGAEAVIVRHQGLLLAFGCFDCLRAHLTMTDVPRARASCCAGTSAHCSPASEWCV